MTDPLAKVCDHKAQSVTKTIRHQGNGSVLSEKNEWQSFAAERTAFRKTKKRLCDLRILFLIVENYVIGSDAAQRSKMNGSRAFRRSYGVSFLFFAAALV